MDGGTGRDVLTISGVAQLAVDVDLQAGTAALFDPATNLVSATVLLALIEDASGTANNDRLDGSSLGNLLDGLAGNDSLAGFDGNDTLPGGQGNDTLPGAANSDQIYRGDGDYSLSGGSGNDQHDGGLGRDTINGGTGVDPFIFLSVLDSPTGTPDLIQAFEGASERINHAGIDADAGVAGDNAFAFIGTAAFAGTSAQVRYVLGGGSLTFVQVRLAGDAVTDMESALQGQLTLAETNFFL